MQIHRLADAGGAVQFVQPGVELLESEFGEGLAPPQRQKMRHWRDIVKAEL